MDRAELLDANRLLAQAIRASEEWQPSYTRHPQTFRQLLMHEAELEQGVAEYLVRLAERAPRYIDWALVPTPIQAAAEPLANKDDAVWAAERIDFERAVFNAITMLVATGGQYGELEYGVALGINELTESVLKAAREQTAGLVTAVTETHRSLIREAIKLSIDLGEDAATTTERIQRVITNPVRAEMIAQTESVNAYQTGLRNFAVETGAKSKTWESLVGACQVCAPLDGETVRIDKPFSNGKDRPSAHPRCRCGVIYTY